MRTPVTLIRISQIHRPIDQRDKDGPAEALLIVTKAVSGETGQESYRSHSTLPCTARQTSTLQRTPRKFSPLVERRVQQTFFGFTGSHDFGTGDHCLLPLYIAGLANQPREKDLFGCSPLRKVFAQP